MRMLVWVGIAATACAPEVDCAGDVLERIPGSRVWVSPAPGAYDGPVDLVVGNRSRDSLACELVEHEACTDLAPYETPLESIDPGACVDMLNIRCATATIACREPGGNIVATWDWAVETE